jgi:hypothetical protein
MIKGIARRRAVLKVSRVLKVLKVFKVLIVRQQNHGCFRTTACCG